MTEIGLALKRCAATGKVAGEIAMGDAVTDSVHAWHSPAATYLAWGEPGPAPAWSTFDAASASGETPVLGGRSWLRLDHASGTLQGAVDRYGLFPILLQHDADGTRVASHPRLMARLLGRRAAPDHEALLELLAFGQLLGERSTLAGVRHLGAGTTLRIARGEPPQIRTSLVELTPRPAPFSQVLEALVAAVDRRLRHAADASIPLSGGLDSRLLLAAALAAGHKPAALSFGAAGSADLEIATQLAARAQVPIVTGEIDGMGFAAAKPTIAVSGGGVVPLHHGHALACPDLVGRTQGRTLLTGTGAETFRAFYYDRGMPGLELLGLPALRGPLLPSARRYVMEAFGRTLAPTAKALPSLAASLASRLSARLDAYAAAAPTAAAFLDRIYLGERVGRFVVGGQQLLDLAYGRAHPFLDSEVASLLAGLPTHVRFGGLWHRQAIGELAPQLLDVAWDRTMRPMGEGLRWHERWPGLAARLRRKHAYGKAAAPMARYDAWLAPELDELTRSLLQCGAAVPEVRHALDLLMQGSMRIHTIGVAGSWREWCTFLTRIAADAAPEGAAGQGLALARFGI